jgi:hypothetical protein
MTMSTKLQNGSVEVARMGHGGKQADFMCDMDAPHPSLGASNSCCFLTSSMPSLTPSLLPRVEPTGRASPSYTLAP